MKILTIGDVVGRRAIEYLSGKLRKTAAALGADLVVCNGENASEIHGLALRDAEALLDCGVDLITLGNHAFGSRDIYGYLDDNTDRIIRPANYPAACPGVGYTLIAFLLTAMFLLRTLDTKQDAPLGRNFRTVQQDTL